jgi:hypothetical protein
MPQTLAQRRKAKAAAQATQARYDAAGMGRRTKGWPAARGSCAVGLGR